MYEDEPLKDYYTLMDIAYIYTWRRVRDLLWTKLIFLKCFLKKNHKCAFLAVQLLSGMD